jgi:spore coat protein CotF
MNVIISRQREDLELYKIKMQNLEKKIDELEDTCSNENICLHNLLLDLETLVTKYGT